MEIEEIDRRLRHFLRTKRLQMGLSQEKLAECAGMTRDRILNIETGRSKDIKVKELCELLIALDISLDDLSREFSNKTINGNNMIALQRIESKIQTLIDYVLATR